jgi:hypothetical protein
MANAVHASHAATNVHAAPNVHAAHAFHAVHTADQRIGTHPHASWPLRALSVVSCWCRTFGVFGNEMGDGVYFLGREVEGPGATVKA